MRLNISKMNFFGQNPKYNFGDVIYDKHGSCGPRMQTNLQLVYIYEGEARIQVDDIPHLLRAGESTLLLPGHVEHFLFSKTGKTRHGWCEVCHARLDAPVLRAYERLPFRGPLTPLMKDIAKMALSLKADTVPSEQHLYDALAQAMLLAYLSAAGFGDKRENPLPGPLRLAVDHIESKYQKACSLEILSGVAGITGAHLIRLFKKYLGTTPVQYVWHKRTEAGAQLLRETGLSISETAYRCGFQNPYHFSRMIKKHVGHAPRTYRRMMWGMQ